MVPSVNLHVTLVTVSQRAFACHCYVIFVEDAHHAGHDRYELMHCSYRIIVSGRVRRLQENLKPIL